MICSGDTLNFDLDALISGSGDTYTYTVLSSDEINVPAGPDRTTASADPITDSYTNTTGTDVTVTYTITPTATNSCVGAPFDLVVTVKAEPAIEAVITAPDNFTADAANPYTTTVCSGELFNIALNALSDDPNSLSDTLWVQVRLNDPADLLSQGADSILHAPVDGAAIAGPLVNDTGSPATVTVTFIPYYETMPDPDAMLNTDECAGREVTLTVTVNPEAVADAGDDQIICGDTGAGLMATASGPGEWSGGSGTFADSSQTNTTYTPDSTEVGTTVELIWTTFDPDGMDPCPAVSDTVEITINEPATVDAGMDQTLCVTDSMVMLSGSITGGTSTGTWSTSGSGTFDPDENTLDATYIRSAADNTAGSVILTLSAADPDGMGPCPAVSGQVAATFNPPATADAGMNDTICGVSPVALSATANGSGEWSGGAGNFADPTSTNTTYTPAPSEVGTTVTLTWTTADPDGTTGPCSEVSDEVDITFDSPAEVDAGTNQTVCADDADVTLAGSIGGSASSGSWSGGLGTFTPDANSLNATYEPTADEIAEQKRER
jgi:hypothetical protein